MNTEYGSRYMKSLSSKKQQPWNLDQEKRSLKVPFNPPKNFVTSYGGTFQNSKGTGQIGSYDHMVKADGTFAIERRKEPKAETDDGVPKVFAGNSSYSVNFPYYGNIPEANKMP